MKILSMNIKVDRLPDGCSTHRYNDESCIFNQDKYCVLKMALNENDTFVHNNRNVIPNDCPLRGEK